MKKIGIFLFFFFFLFARAFATEIELKTDKTKLELGEAFLLNVRIYPDASGSTVSFGGNIEIPGIENFSVFSKQSQTQFEQHNTEISMVQEYTYQLQPTKEGTFTLGPVTYKNGNSQTVGKQSLEIQVGDTKNMLSSPGIQKSGNTLASSSQKSLGDLDLSGLFGLREVISPIYFIVLLGIFLFLGFFGILKAVLHADIQSPVFKIKTQNAGEKKTLSHSPEEIFFKKIRKYRKNLGEENVLQTLLSSIGAFREYYMQLGFPIQKSHTLIELKKNSQIKEHFLFPYFQKLYFLEYDEKKCQSSVLENILGDILQHRN